MFSGRFQRPHTRAVRFDQHSIHARHAAHRLNRCRRYAGRFVLDVIGGACHHDMAVHSQRRGQFKRQVGQLIQAQVARRQAGLGRKDARRGCRDDLPASADQFLRQAEHGRGLAAAAREADNITANQPQRLAQVHGAP